MNHICRSQQPMFKNLLIANRGEIAIRIARTASDLGISTVAIYAEDDSQSLHTRHADRALGLGAVGVPAYLDTARIIALAKEAGCDVVHPGYGFLSENAEFARRCAKKEITFVGPTPETLDLFGDNDFLKHESFHGVDVSLCAFDIIRRQATGKRQ